MMKKKLIAMLVAASMLAVTPKAALATGMQGEWKLKVYLLMRF